MNCQGDWMKVFSLKVINRIPFTITFSASVQSLVLYREIQFWRWRLLIYGYTRC